MLSYCARSQDVDTLRTDSVGFTLDEARVIAFMLDEREEYKERMNVLQKRLVIWAAQRANLVNQLKEANGKAADMKKQRQMLEEFIGNDRETIRLMRNEINSAKRRSLWTGIKSFLAGAAAATVVCGVVNSTR